MDRYIRAQHKGFTFAQLQAHTSHDGGDGLGEDVGGVCACTSVAELRSNTVMGALGPDDEVIVFEGVHLSSIYDGERVRPVREIARFTVADLYQRPELIGEEI